MSDPYEPRTHSLNLRCACTDFGTPMIVIAAWAASIFRYEGADYLCPNCSRIWRACDVPRFLFPDRIRLRRL